MLWCKVQEGDRALERGQVVQVLLAGTAAAARAGKGGQGFSTHNGSTTKWLHQGLVEGKQAQQRS